MVFLKDIIIYLFIFIFIYLIFEYFYSLSPKIIECFDSKNVIDFKNFPGTIDFNFSQVGDLTSVQSKIDDLNNRQAANEELLELLKKQLGSSSS
tara:strand:- start:384 stop:665 length:282 start_codon:yes stop_codon:yes gene_type:complete